MSCTRLAPNSLSGSSMALSNSPPPLRVVSPGGVVRSRGAALQQQLGLGCKGGATVWAQQVAAGSRAPGRNMQVGAGPAKGQPRLAPRARLCTPSRCIRMTQGHRCCCCCCCGGGRSEAVVPKLPLYRDLVGNTPLVDLTSISANPEVKILGKCEFANPSGSIKDRMALHALSKAEAQGKLKPGGTIVAATSGNTGTAVAMIAAMRGYKYIVITNEKTSREKCDAMRLYGGEVVIAPCGVPAHHPEHYQNMAATLCAENADYFDLDQYNNKDNPEAYYKSLGPEIWNQTEGAVTHFVAAGSTGGTVSGTGQYLKEQNSDVCVMLPDPVGSVFWDFWVNHKAETELKALSYQCEGVGKDSIPGAIDFSVIDKMMQVTDKQAVAMCHRLAQTEGLMVGSSAGLNMHAAVELSKTARPGSQIVVILPDTGIKYLSKIYNPEWCITKGLDAASEDKQAHLLDKAPALVAA